MRSVTLELKVKFYSSTKTYRYRSTIIPYASAPSPPDTCSKNTSSSPHFIKMIITNKKTYTTNRQRQKDKLMYQKQSYNIFIKERK